MSITVSTQLRTYTCGQCGGLYAIGENYAQKKYEEGGFWNCPYCRCNWGYPKEGSLLEQAKRDNAKLLAKLDQEKAATQAAREQRDHNERRLKATKGVVTRLKNRTVKGVCPCCEATFPDLELHMQEHHPEFEKKEETGDAK